MARLPQGILGGVLGKVGNVVGSSWKGIPILKSRPLSVANPRTTKQVAQRTKMSNTVAFAQEILSSVIKPLNDRFAQQASGYNDFVRRNIHLFANEQPTPAAELRLSVGKMSAVRPSLIGAQNGSAVVSLNWPTELTDAFASADDLAYVVIYNATQKNFGISSGEFNRGSEEVEVTMSSPVATDDALRIWLAFRRVDGTIVSNTGHSSDSV
jgi:hypothetical protein